MNLEILFHKIAPGCHLITITIHRTNLALTAMQITNIHLNTLNTSVTKLTVYVLSTFHLEYIMDFSGWTGHQTVQAKMDIGQYGRIRG